MSRLVDTQDHGRKRRNESHQRAAIFSPHLAGANGGGGGVWTGGRSTNTKQSKTLFVTNVDPQVQLDQVAALFQSEPGFFAFRTVRRMCFVDFHSIAEANLAMRKCQNHLFAGLDPTSKRLLIDYDKDDRAKRDTQFAAQVGRELNSQENGEIVELSCKACGKFGLKLRIAAPKTLEALPRRAIDQSLVIDTAKYVTEFELGKGEERALRRQGGVELQYRLLCKSCSLPVCYASTPFDSTIKHFFVLADAMQAERTMIRAGKRIQGERKFDVACSATPAASAAAPGSLAAEPPAEAASSSAAAATSVESAVASPLPSPADAAATSALAPPSASALSSAALPDIAPAAAVPAASLASSPATSQVSPAIETGPPVTPPASQQPDLAPAVDSADPVSCSAEAAGPLA